MNRRKLLKSLAVAALTPCISKILPVEAKAAEFTSNIPVDLTIERYIQWERNQIIFSHTLNPLQVGQTMTGTIHLIERDGLKWLVEKPHPELFVTGKNFLDTQ